MESAQPKLEAVETDIRQVEYEDLGFLDMQSINWNQEDNNHEVQINAFKPTSQNQIKLQDNTNINKYRIQSFLHSSFAPPSFSDIQKSLQIVRKAFPETFTDKTINDLLKNLMKKLNNHPIKPEQHVKLHFIQNYNTTSLHNKTSQLSDISKRHFKRRLRRNNSLNYKLGRNGDKMNQLDRFGDDEIDKNNPQKGIAARLQSIWTQQFQQLLLSLYKKGHQFSFIRDHFQEQYPKFKSFFSVNSLRGKFYKIIRQTIRKLLTFIDQIGNQKFPNMIKLSYNIIQNIMYFQEGRFVRMLLVDLYFCNHLNAVLIDRIIDGIVSFVRDTKDQHADYRLIDF